MGESWHRAESGCNREREGGESVETDTKTWTLLVPLATTAHVTEGRATDCW